MRSRNHWIAGHCLQCLNGFDASGVVVVLAICISVFIVKNADEAFMTSADCVGEHGLCVGQRDQWPFFAWLGTEGLCGFAQLVGPQEQQMAFALLRASAEVLLDGI